ncbi:MAG: hypothetical protein A4E28_03006 [Methanocella sp. PtaU1.Bin125]|nr:MAG: hypothetical protein A4E28_03006 [Methanocella sp. PtaU1.Bin125]
MRFMWTRKISRRAARSGTGTRMISSNRPGLSSAGSMMSGRLVAPITMTPRSSSRPSNSDNSWFTMRSVTRGSPAALPRTGASASSSSRKTTAGATCRAFLNTSLMCFSDSPYHFDRRSLPLAVMKLAWLSLAMALASSVLPVPGGP